MYMYKVAFRLLIAVFNNMLSIIIMATAHEPSNTETNIVKWIEIYQSRPQDVTF